MPKYITLGAGVISGALTGEGAAVELDAVMDEYVSLIPLLVPVGITFIGLRKALAFLWGTLKSA